MKWCELIFRQILLENICIFFSFFRFSFHEKSQEVEETLKRIASHKGVVGTIVVNNEGLYKYSHFILSAPK